MDCEKECLKVKKFLAKKNVNPTAVIIHGPPFELHITIAKNECVNHVLSLLNEDYRRDFFFVRVTKQGFKPKPIAGAFSFGEKKKRGRPKTVVNDDILINDEEDFYDEYLP
jgi:hypothetical protein